MTTKNMNMSQQLRTTAEGFPLIGYCIYWSASEFTIDYDKITKALADNGFKAGLAKETLAKNAVIRAIKEKAKKAKGSLHKKVVEEETMAGFAIASSEVHNQSNKDFDVEFSVNIRIVFDKSSKGISVLGASKAVAQEIEELYKVYRSKYTSSQFRTVVLRIAKEEMSAFSIREGGGVYFVPYTEKEKLDRLEAFISAFPGCSLDIIPVVDAKQAKATMWKAMVGDVQQELKEFKEDLDKQPSEIKTKSFETRLARFKALRVKVDMYESVLSGTAKDLKSELDQLTSNLRTRILK